MLSLWEVTHPTSPRGHSFFTQQEVSKTSCPVVTAVGQDQGTRPAGDEGFSLENKQPRRMQGLVPQECIL